MKPAVSILIPNWNGTELLKQFLPSVLAAAGRYGAAAHAAVEVIVVDDGSTDGSVSHLRELGFRERAEEPAAPGEDTGIARRLVVNEKNLGFSAACSRGFAAARHPLVFLLNNDVEVDVDCLEPLVQNFQDPSVFAAHCHAFEFRTGKECGTGKLGGFRRGFLRVHGSYAPKPAATSGGNLPLRSMFAGGGSAMFDREKWRQLGGFEPLLAPAYWEDVEIGYRAWKRGFTVLYEPRSIVRHRVSSTLDGKRLRRVQERNRLIYHWIHLHDSRFLFSHIIWVNLLAFSAPLRFQAGFLLSCWAALRRLPEIRKRRREEKLAAKRSDREVLRLFTELSRHPGITVYGGGGEGTRKGRPGATPTGPSFTPGVRPQ